MADQQGQRQERTGSTAPAEPARDIRSDDAIASVDAIAQQQVKQQQRINAGRHDTIGSAP
jgi:hypothetical protein